MSNVATRFNALFGIKATTGLITGDEAILGFKTAEQANTAVVRIGIGTVAQAFTGAWLVTMSRAQIEAKIVGLRAIVGGAR